tara:strand:+ start:30 stop:482 length:453 start_codon:yes stop_codon:yes gene_type:complete
MKCSVNNKSGVVMTRLERMIKEFFPFSQERLGFNKPVEVELHSDKENSEKDFGKTAHYSPSEMKIVLYIDGRHHKDLLRSLSHELVHHAQNCRGDFDGDFTTQEGYAQTDDHLRKMEEEAYLEGNMILRDYEDGIKTEQLYEKLVKEWCK